ncbi:hypothetical protein AQF52_4839 [Streptomyces venezuelae]|nr:hypothetical protein AQF52_4839 [Streptomyces venezuelae]CUM39103.1 hypothetical protein BN2537_7171 [Streptomyces venezuelae]
METGRHAGRRDAGPRRMTDGDEADRVVPCQGPEGDGHVLFG